MHLLHYWYDCIRDLGDEKRYIRPGASICGMDEWRGYTASWLHAQIGKDCVSVRGPEVQIEVKID